MHGSDAVLALLEESGALRRGHFVLSSGLHSDRYCQCATLFERPEMGERMARLLAGSLPIGFVADVVLSPALGGVLWGYELARAMGCRSLFAERKEGKPFEMRRGFALARGERVLLAEDVVTTGGSVMELVPLVERAGAEVAGFASIVDRSRGSFRPAQELFCLARLDFETYGPTECPLCRAGIPTEKPGSRSAAPAA